MISICSNCGNHEWDKEVTGNKIKCPKCGYIWEFKKLPLYILTGCSGIGKTTAAQELQKMTDEIIVQEVDQFNNLMHPQTDDDNYYMLEQIYQISRNNNQANKPTIWTSAGNVDKLGKGYGARYFSEIKVLALTADPDVIRQHMTEGRHITDEDWINGSINYNEYFRTHNEFNGTKFDTFDITNKSPREVAEHILEWNREK